MLYTNTRDDALCCEQEHIHPEAVEAARARLPDDIILYDLADFFKVFGDSTRMKLLFSLDAHELCVCDLCALLGMTKSAVSHQLRVLRQEKLVRTRKSGKNIIYTLADDHVRDILEKGREHILERNDA